MTDALELSLVPAESFPTAAQATPDLPPDEAAHALLLRAYPAGTAAVFDEPGSPTPDEAALRASKAGADALVGAKLAKWADDGRTAISLTNAGRYRAISGGWLAFLREPDGARGGGGGRERNPELEQMRLALTKLRLSTFWWSFGLSVAGFVISIVSLTVALTIGDRLMR
jgi:hypothetical protein